MSEEKDRGIHMRENSKEKTAEIYQKYSEENLKLASEKASFKELEKQTRLASKYAHYLLST